ncbi:lactonase family protein [Candidatus Binatia bacterium]|nr:lactonase family protein [Candidatus Binatia bacterium]
MTKQRLNVQAVAVGTVVGLLSILVVPAMAAAQFVYVNNNRPSPDNSVSAFVVGTGGTLTAVTGSPFLTGGGGSFSPSVGGASVVSAGQRLYATNSITNSIAAFDINADGSLSTVPGSPFSTVGTRPNGIAASADGTRLFVADLITNNVSVYDIASNGALSMVLMAPFSVATAPLDAAIDSVASRLFLTHTGSVGVYSIALDGSLTPVAGSPFAAGTGVRGLALTADGARVYVANGSDDTVSGYTVGGGGTLSGIAGSPFAAGDSPTDALVHPTLSVLYVANDLTSDISAYSINAGTGALTPLAGSPFAAGGNGTAGLAIDPGTNRLFAANGGTHGSPGRSVSVFDIAPDGSLSAVAGSPFSTGVASGSPSAIAVVGICPATPFTGCRTAFRSALHIKNSTDNTKDTITWRWTNGQATTQAELGIPFMTRTYALCVYDGDGLAVAASVAGDQLCSGVPCWSLAQTTGIRFKDKTGASYGVTRITGKGSTTSKSRITVRAKGANTPDPTMPLNITGGITAQFINSDSGVCFTSTYTGAGIRKNQADKFSAKAP